MKFSFAFAVTAMLLLAVSNRSDAQTSWKQQTTSLSNSLLSICFTSPSTGYVSGESGTFARTTNAGTTWTTVNTGTYASLNAVCFVNDTGYVFGTGPTALRSVNGGLTWTPLTFSVPGASGIAYIKSAIMFDGKNGIVCGYYVVSPNLKAFTARTTDAGGTWQVQKHDSITSFYSLSFINRDIGYVVGSMNGMNAPILKTTDGGTTWAAQQSGTFGTLGSVHFTDANIGHAGGSFASTIRTTNGGATWRTESSAPGSIMAFYGTSPGTVFAVTGGFSAGKIYRSLDSGATWVLQYDAPSPLNAVYFANSQTGFAAGDQGTIVNTVNGTASVSASLLLPKRFNVQQNFPNPFNPATTIPFSIPAAAHVTASVYNALGQKVGILTSREYPAGDHQLRWNAENYAAGIYLCSVESAGHSAVVRMVLIK